MATYHGSDFAKAKFDVALAFCLYDTGFTVSVASGPDQGICQDPAVSNKTDKADARLIARFCQAIQPMAWQPPPLHFRQAQAWVRRLEALQDIHHLEMNQMNRLAHYLKSDPQYVSSLQL